MVAVTLPSRRNTVVNNFHLARVETQHSGNHIQRDFILFASTLEPRKNLDRLVSAYDRLTRDMRQEFQLLIAGPPGWNCDESLHRIRNHKQGVRYLGIRAASRTFLLCLRLRRCLSTPRCTRASDSRFSSLWRRELRQWLRQPAPSRKWAAIVLCVDPYSIDDIANAKGPVIAFALGPRRSRGRGQGTRLRLDRGDLRPPDVGILYVRIGINALSLIPGGVGGTEIYLRKLLAALAGIDSLNEYFVFTNAETGSDLVPRTINFHWKPQAAEVCAESHRDILQNGRSIGGKGSGWRLCCKSWNTETVGKDTAPAT